MVRDRQTMRMAGHFRTGLDPPHVAPSDDNRTSYATNDGETA